jgi:hypothetical protein
MADFTIVNYVVEVAAAGKPWITWPDGVTPTTSEREARSSYRAATNARHAAWTRLRLVKRTATVTDEVIEGEAAEAYPCANCGHSFGAHFSTGCDADGAAEVSCLCTTYGGPHDQEER